MATARSRARCVSATGGMKMGAEAEPTQIRLVCVGDDDVATGSHVRRWMETRPMENIELDVQFDVELSAAVDTLENGDADFLAISASRWHMIKGAPDTVVATALPRRDENHILVADDRLNFLPPKTIISKEIERNSLHLLPPHCFRIQEPDHHII